VTAQFATRICTCIKRNIAIAASLPRGFRTNLEADSGEDDQDQKKCLTGGGTFEMLTD
jgi:hypothetical protein